MRGRGFGERALQAVPGRARAGRARAGDAGRARVSSIAAATLAALALAALVVSGPDGSTNPSGAALGLAGTSGRSAAGRTGPGETTPQAGARPDGGSPSGGSPRATSTAGAGTQTATRVGTIEVAHPAGPGFAVAQSNNWSGYDEGTLSTGRQFVQASATWNVPGASQAVAGQAEASATWVGIGGGCLDTGCLATDQTLIQAGVEENVSTSGSATYSAWYETIPAPAVTIPLAVAPGDEVWVNVAELHTPGVFGIDIFNLTTGGAFFSEFTYPSSQLTAEWIEESPVVVSAGGSSGVAPLPRLAPIVFHDTRANFVPPFLRSADAIELVGPSGAPVAYPSAPDVDRDSFSDCTYAPGCPTPAEAEAYSDS